MGEPVTSETFPGTPLSYSGGLVRSYLTAFRKAGYLEDVRAQATPETAALMDDPPMLWTWSDACVRCVTELLELAARRGGSPAVKNVGLLLVRESIGPVLMPVFRTAFAAFGFTPLALLKNIPLFTRAFLRGITFSFVETAPTVSTFTLTFAQPVPTSSFIVWEGISAFGLEVSKVQGTVDPVQISPDGRTGRIVLRWS